MEKFNDWVKQNNPGNYVSVDVTGMPLSMVAAAPGIVNTSPHITLMYSKNSHVPLAHINYVLSRRSLLGTNLLPSGVELFDDGEAEDAQCAIVLTVESRELTDLHNHLIRLGCVHSYPNYRPHATLLYKCPKAQAELIQKDILRNLDSISLTCTRFNNTWVKEDWASTLNS